MAGYVLGAIGIVGFVLICCMGIWLGLANEQKKREAGMIMEQQAHETRLAMIERGLTPPSETPSARDKSLSAAYATLGTIGTLPPVFAWLSGGQPMAWVAAGFIGTAAVVGAVIVYLKNASQ